MSVWKKIDQSHKLHFICEDDDCIYAREYKSGQGYQAGETNQLILNFKKSPSMRDTNQWGYRDRDIKRFAEEVSAMFTVASSVSITAIPSSKAKTDTEYSNRFEDAFDHLLRLRPRLLIEWPIENMASVQPAHIGGSRDPLVIMQNYKWIGFQHPVPQTLVVFDDVVTTGSHFRAFADFLRTNGFTGRIVGMFWARAVFPSAQDDFTVVV